LPTPLPKLPTSTLFPPSPSPPPVRTNLLGLPSQPVDVRTATVEQIAAIPAIGPERAAQLVAARGTHPLESVDDVVKLLGLTGVDRVRAHPYLRF
jgi:predicted DNA-binding helix-hairpin-helix protein